MWIEAEPVYGALVSLAIGLIIGLERGWQVRQLGDNQRASSVCSAGSAPCCCPPWGPGWPCSVC